MQRLQLSPQPLDLILSILHLLLMRHLLIINLKLHEHKLFLHGADITLGFLLISLSTGFVEYLDESLGLAAVD